MKVILATDHAGFELKEKIKAFLEADYEVEDMGAFEYDKLDDYPDFIKPAAQKIANEGCKGIIFGWSGQGEGMVANKVKGIRAAVYHGNNMDIIKLSREHNDANVLSIGAGFVDEEETKKAVKLWLETDFTNEERHVRRINKIE